MNSISNNLQVLDQQRTRDVLNIFDLMIEIKKASIEYSEGLILSPERMVIPRNGEGVMLSMPAVADDISVHKLVNVEPSNQKKKLPTIFGLVTVFDSITGQPLCVLDGPEVTGCRTAAVSMLGIDTFLATSPSRVLIIGCGTQAAYHVRALKQVYPNAEIFIRGIDLEGATSFCDGFAEEGFNLTPCGQTDIPERTDVVILLTTSRKPIYYEAGQTGRLIIGVGAFKPNMAEIGAHTLSSSDVYVDDLEGAKHEAGDLIQANTDWSQVHALAEVVNKKFVFDAPIVFKTVGTAAWDLAAGRVAVKSILNLE